MKRLTKRISARSKGSKGEKGIEEKMERWGEGGFRASGPKYSGE